MSLITFSEKRILIVDDDRELATFSAMSLQLLGVVDHIEIANSAQEAFRKMLSAPFDMVISDMHMPGLDGLALMRQIRRHYPEVKLILMTGDNTVEVEDSANEVGVDRCIDKPYIPRQFAETVSALLADGAGDKNDSENVERGVI